MREISAQALAVTRLCTTSGCPNDADRGSEICGVCSTGHGQARIVAMTADARANVPEKGSRPTQPARPVELAPSLRRLTDYLHGDPLSDREAEVLARLATGATAAEIGDSMFLAASTVKSHTKKLLAKLGARNRTHAVALGYETGLLTKDAG